jgi:hypothetical protein
VEANTIAAARDRTHRWADAEPEQEDADGGA